MKILRQKPLFFHGRIKPVGTTAHWTGKPQSTGSASSQSLERIKAIGFTTEMDDYEKRKLGIFNQLNFFQLITGVIIPIAGAISNRHFPVSAWIVACMPVFISILVLTLTGDLISEVIRFDAAVLSSFGLPRILPGAASGT